jgi:hypothetical protein
VLVHCRKGLTCRVRASVANAILLANIAVLVLLLAGGTASAQNGIFDTILGRRAAPTTPRASRDLAFTLIEQARYAQVDGARRRATGTAVACIRYR